MENSPSIMSLYAKWAALYIAQAKMDDDEAKPFQDPLSDLEKAIASKPISTMQDFYIQQTVETCFGSMPADYSVDRLNHVHWIAKAELVELESLLALIDLHRENYTAWNAISNLADSMHPDFDPYRKGEVQALNDRDAELMERIILHPANSLEVIKAKGDYLASHQALGALGYEEAQAFVDTFAADEKGAHIVGTLGGEQPSIEALIDAYNEAQAVWSIRFDADSNTAGDCPEWDAYEATEQAVIEYPCSTIEEVRVKARFLLNDEFPYESVKQCKRGDTDVLKSFLRSLLGEAPAQEVQS